MLNTTNRCEFCGGVVTNIDGKRYTIDALTALHNETCPGLHRRTRTTAKQAS